MNSDRKKALRDLAILDAVDLVRREAQIQKALSDLLRLCDDDKSGRYNEFSRAVRSAEDKLPQDDTYRFITEVLKIPHEEYEYTSEGARDRLLAEFYGIEDRYDQDTDWAAGCDPRQEQHPIDLLNQLDSEKE